MSFSVWESEDMVFDLPDASELLLTDNGGACASTDSIWESRERREVGDDGRTLRAEEPTWESRASPHFQQCVLVGRRGSSSCRKPVGGRLHDSDRLRVRGRRGRASATAPDKDFLKVG